MVSRAPLLATLALAGGCLGPNPYLDDEVGNESESESGSASETTTTESTTNETTTLETSSTEGSPTCTNGMQDGNETAVDCGGGECPACNEGETCVMGSDCISGVCEGTCVPAACDDGVLNGGETEVDCGGPCTFCEHSAFITAWDDLEGVDAEFPTVAMNDDGELALAFSHDNDSRLRWFQDLGAPLGASAAVSSSLVFGGNQTMPLALRDDLDEASVLVMLAGADLMSVTSDLFVAEQSLAEGEGTYRVVFQGDPSIFLGAVGSRSTQAIFAWKQDKQIYLRRRDYAIGDAEWIDLDALPAETDQATFDGDTPDLAVGPDGVIVLTWSRCVKAGTPCSIALRRFDTDWLDPEPVVISPTDVYLTTPHVAIGDDGRVGVVWSLLDIGNSWAYGNILAADLTPEGEPWVLQTGLAVLVETDIAALDDGTFAFAWAEPEVSKVHLRRYLGNDEPKLPGIGDEAPWPMTSEPSSPAIANADRRVVVVWSARDGEFTQIHGQVLSY